MGTHLLHMSQMCLFLPATATAQTCTLSLHDALPISSSSVPSICPSSSRNCFRSSTPPFPGRFGSICIWPPRSEEHTSELQSRFDLVCRLLLEKKREQTSSTSPAASAPGLLRALKCAS